MYFRREWGKMKKDFLVDIFNLGGGGEPTVSGHYGFKPDEFDKLLRNILCDMIQENNKTKVLDKWFPANILEPKNGAIIRCRALAYASAFQYLERMFP